MFNRNEVRLLGRVSNVSIKTGSKGKYAIVTVATNEAYKDKNDEWQQSATFHRVTTFTKSLVEKLEKKVSVGDLIDVEARLQNNSREKDGDTVYYIDIVATRIGIVAYKAEKTEERDAA